MKHLISVLTLAAALAFSSVALAEKVGFVNVERITRDSAPAKRAQAKLEKEFAARTAEVTKLEKQGRDLEVELSKETVTLPEAQRREKERQLQTVTRDFQRISRELREDLNLRKNEELASVMDKVQKAINQIAEADKFDIIFTEGAAYVSAKVDITERVIKSLADK
jgi:outer membrane protein